MSPFMLKQGIFINWILVYIHFMNSFRQSCCIWMPFLQTLTPMPLCNIPPFSIGNVFFFCMFLFLQGLANRQFEDGKKEEEKLCSLIQDLEEDSCLQRKRASLTSDTRLDSALHQWFVQARAEGMPISGSTVQAQAEQIDKQLNGEESNFKVSIGWLDRFKKCHGISVSIARVSDQLMQKLHTLIQTSCDRLSTTGATFQSRFTMLMKPAFAIECSWIRC